MEKERKVISIFANGSRGDIQPYIALAIELQKKHDVHFLTSKGYKSFVQEYGIHFVNVYDLDIEYIMHHDENSRECMAKGDVNLFFKQLSRWHQECAEGHVKRMLDELDNHKPDFFIAGSTGEYWYHYVKKIYDIPCVEILLNILGFNKEHMLFGIKLDPNEDQLAILLDIASYSYDNYKHFDGEIKKLNRATLGSAFPKEEYVSLQRRRILGNPQDITLVCQSKLFRDILFPIANKNIIYTGPCTLDASQQQSKTSFGDNYNKLEEFLRENTSKEVVYCGFGSMISKSPEYMTEFIVKALFLSNKRGIVLGGNAKLSMEALMKGTSDKNLIHYARGNIFFVNKISHEAIFPRVACTIHHGGIGTLFASLRSACPSIITPVFLDQFDNAYVVNELKVGIGFAKQLQQIKSTEVAEAIISLSSNKSMSSRYREVSEVIQEEKGQSRIEEEIQKLSSVYANLKA